MIHALPGMGADKRMFPGPWGALPGLVAHDWPRHQGERTLAEVARVIAEAYAVKDGDTIIGASLGGMVACEIAKIRNLQGLFLVGSATNKSEVSRLLAFLHPLASVAPIDWLRYSAGKIPLELAQMFSGVETSFVRSMCAAVFQWSGLGSVPVRCMRIHGRHDLIIPPPAQADLLLDGGHLISVTHPKECVEFIRANS
jgi:pimeloyl-ACP methyl ester carboxylesterase